MKNLIPFLIFTCLACDDDGMPNNQHGCVTGIPIHKTEVVTIGCGTQEQFNNFTIYHVDYKDLKWTPVNSCNECK